MRQVMDGFRVLDMTQFLAGPAATRVMVEAGAEVIKIEWPGGDPSKGFPYIRDGRSAYYVQQNRGKKSVGINLKNPAGPELVKKLLPHCDVLIENFAPGVMARLGLGWEEVRRLHPQIIMCSISAFGQTGPLSHLPGFDNIGQAYSGVTSMIGNAGEAPPFLQPAMGDVSTGVHAACAIAFALLYRERTGKGQFLDISLLDTYFHQHEVNVQAWSCSKGAIQPTRSGPHHYAIAPAGIFRGKEMYFFLLPLLHLWPKFCQVIGREDLIKHPKFIDNANRAIHQKELIPIIENWLQAQASDQQALRLLEDGHIPVAPILTVEQACQHPHMIERETVRWIYDRALGSFQVPGMPLRFSEFPGHLDLEAPFLGEHNTEVLGRYLGYSSAAVAELEKTGVLCTEPIPEPIAEA